MQLHMDAAGRIVIPKPLRERLGFRPRVQLEAIEQPSGVLIRRVEERPALVWEGKILVHQGWAEPGADFDRGLGEVREERVRDLLNTDGDPE